MGRLRGSLAFSSRPALTPEVALLVEVVNGEALPSEVRIDAPLGTRVLKFRPGQSSFNPVYPPKLVNTHFGATAEHEPGER